MKKTLAGIAAAVLIAMPADIDAHPDNYPLVPDMTWDTYSDARWRSGSTIERYWNKTEDNLVVNGRAGCYRDRSQSDEWLSAHCNGEPVIDYQSACFRLSWLWVIGRLDRLTNNDGKPDVERELRVSRRIDDLEKELCYQVDR